MSSLKMVPCQSNCGVAKHIRGSESHRQCIESARRTPSASGQMSEAKSDFSTVASDEGFDSETMDIGLYVLPIYEDRRESTIRYLEVNYDTSHPGCPGCRPDMDDGYRSSCHCETISNLEVDEESFSRNYLSIVQDAMRHAYVDLFPEDRRHPHVVSDVVDGEAYARIVDLSEDFRTITSRDLNIDTIKGYYGDEIRMRESADMYSECMDELLRDPYIGAKFSKMFLGGHDLNVDGVKAFLRETNAPSDPLQAAPVDERVESAREVWISAAMVSELHLGSPSQVQRAESEPIDGMIPSGLVAITTGGSRVVDGYHRVTTLRIKASTRSSWVLTLDLS